MNEGTDVAWENVSKDVVYENVKGKDFEVGVIILVVFIVFIYVIVYRLWFVGFRDRGFGGYRINNVYWFGGLIFFKNFGKK